MHYKLQDLAYWLLQFLPHALIECGTLHETINYILYCHEISENYISNIYLTNVSEAHFSYHLEGIETLHYQKLSLWLEIWLY